MIIRYGLPLVAVVALVFAVVQMTQAQKKEPVSPPIVEPARSPYESQLAGSGIIEPETENIAIGTNLPGIVEELFVGVGDMVKPGQPLFRLDDRQLKAELAIREADLKNAIAMREKVKSVRQPEELPPAKAAIAVAEAGLTDAQKMLALVQGDNIRSSISQEERIRRQMDLLLAESKLIEAKADLQLLEAPAWRPDLLVADSVVAQVEAKVQQTKTELERLTVLAPKMPASMSQESDFKVLQVNIRPGEFVGMMQGEAFIVLGNVGKLYVRVDIDENEIDRFRPNLDGIAKPRGNPDKPYDIEFVRVEPYVIPKEIAHGREHGASRYAGSASDLSAQDGEARFIRRAADGGIPEHSEVIQR